MPKTSKDLIIEELREKLDKATKALEFYDGAIRQNWAVDLNKLKELARQTLKEIE